MVRAVDRDGGGGSNWSILLGALGRGPCYIIKTMTPRRLPPWLICTPAPGEDR